MTARDQDRRGLGGTLARRVRDRLAVHLTSMPPAEQAMVAGGLIVLDRAVSVLDKLDAVADAQLKATEMGQRVLGMFPPLIGKLGELIDLELEAARERLGQRNK